MAVARSWPLVGEPQDMVGAPQRQHWTGQLRGTAAKRDRDKLQYLENGYFAGARHEWASSRPGVYSRSYDQPTGVDLGVPALFSKPVPGPRISTSSKRPSICYPPCLRAATPLHGPCLLHMHTRRSHDLWPSHHLLIPWSPSSYYQSPHTAEQPNLSHMHCPSTPGTVSLPIPTQPAPKREIYKADTGPNARLPNQDRYPQLMLQTRPG